MRAGGWFSEGRTKLSTPDAASRSSFESEHMEDAAERFGGSYLVLLSRLLSGVGRFGAWELQLRVKQGGPELKLEPDISSTGVSANLARPVPGSH